jgi:branched-chain amino acid transport system ATP-binding protein
MRVAAGIVRHRAPGTHAESRPKPGRTGSSMSPSLLEVHGVRFAYAGILALDDVSLEVSEGDACCIVGPNGAGKTTLAKAIMGVLRPAAGHVRFDGRAISGLRPSRVPRHGIGIVLEGRHVFEQLSVRTNLELGAYWRRLSRTELQDEVERVYTLFPDLEQAEHKAAADLSGGQQQMLCVGRALMGRPRLLILDEPSMGLSPKLAGDLYSALASLRDSGLALLLIEQNARLAFDLCSRGYVLQHGRVVLEGTVDELRATDMVRRIYLGVERLDAQLARSSATGANAHDKEGT